MERHQAEPQAGHRAGGGHVAHVTAPATESSSPRAPAAAWHCCAPCSGRPGPFGGRFAWQEGVKVAAAEKCQAQGRKNWRRSTRWGAAARTRQGPSAGPCSCRLRSAAGDEESKRHQCRGSQVHGPGKRGAQGQGKVAVRLSASPPSGGRTLTRSRSLASAMSAFCVSTSVSSI